MFYTRNSGYIPPEHQLLIERKQLLIAGCGVGSFLAEGLLRLGFLQQILVDGDIIEIHNLNRQNFRQSDVGRFKSDALADRLRSINKDSQIQPVAEFLTASNTASVLEGVDLIIDTVDFVDLPAIVRLHDEANQRGIPIISSFSAGWGSVAIVALPRPGKPCWFREIFHLPQGTNLDSLHYSQAFVPLVQKLAAHLNPLVLADLKRTLTEMKDGKPCPASHVSPGTLCTAALVSTLAYQIMAGQKVIEAPFAAVIDLLGIVQTQKGVSLL